MKKLITTFSFLVLSIAFVITIEAQVRIDTFYNQFGQIIKIGEERFTYPVVLEESQSIESKSVNSLREIKNSCEEFDCDVIWEDTVFGDCIGTNNSFLPYDFDGDGILEIISHAQYIHSSYWFVLKYEEETQSYIKIHQCIYFGARIEKLILADVNNDGKSELVLAADRSVEVVDLQDFSTLASIETPSSWDISHMKFGDADNDGINEIVTCSKYLLTFINSQTFEVENVVSVLKGDFEIGNVDFDDELEVVFSHGVTMEFSSDGTIVDQYDFKPNDESELGYIVLSNIDSDERLEAIASNGREDIEAYDVETSTMKFAIEIEIDLRVLTMYDLEDDGQAEIFYGDAQWGGLHCHNSNTGSRKWSIGNPEPGVFGIAVGDFDGDNNKEVVWTVGCNNSGPDYIYVHDVISRALEYQTADIRGPFHDVEVVDIDQDGELEIITLSEEGDSGYGVGVLTVYDAVTKEIEHRTDQSYFEDAFWEFYSFAVIDHLNDGDLDIVVSNGLFDTYKWILDGDTYQLEERYEYDEAVGQLTSMRVYDIDSDGVEEIIGYNAAKLSIISTVDFSVEREIEFSSPGYRWDLEIGNVLGSDVADIIVSKGGNLCVFDGATFEETVISDNYRSFTLYDLDDSGDMEIIIENSGRLEVIEGNGLQVLETSSNLDINVHAIEIQMVDVNGDGVLEVLFTTDVSLGVYSFANRTAEYHEFPVIGFPYFDAMEVSDYDNDGISNVILGTNNGVIEVDLSCFRCFLFEAQLEKKDAFCENNAGVIYGLSNDSSTTFTMNDGQVFIDSITGLSPGIYDLKAINDIGCEIDLTIEIDGSILEYQLFRDDKTCDDELDGEAEAIIIEGTMPFSYEWSNGDLTASISSLDTGIYYITVTDGYDCVVIDSVVIAQSVLNTSLTIDKLPCSDSEDGIANVFIVEGNGGYTYQWDSDEGTSSIDTLGTGMHVVQVTDEHGCISVHNFDLEPSILNTEIELLDMPCQGQTNGSARVTVLEGVSPYTYEWSDGLGDNPTMFNLLAGTYIVTTTDNNDCRSIDTVVIENVPILYVDDSISICEDESYSLGDSIWFNSGIYEYPINDCDSILRIDLDVRLTQTSSLAVSLCEGDTLWFLDQPYFETAIHNIITEDSYGCDSLIELSLTLTDQIERLDTLHLCKGDSLLVFNEYILDEQLLSNSFQSQAGCDSIQYFQVELHEIPTQILNYEICEGDSLWVANTWLDSTGDYELKVSYGGYCDSFYMVSLIVEELNTFYDTLRICEGDSIWLQDQWVYEQGDYEYTISGAQCDEIQATFVEVIAPIVSNVDIVLCPSDSILIDDQWIFNDDSITLQYVSSAGCDSLVINNIIKFDEPDEPQLEIDCDDQSILATIDVSDEWSILWSNNDTGDNTNFYQEGTAEVVLSALPDCEVSFDLTLPYLPKEFDVNEISNRITAENQIIRLDLDIDSSEYQIYWSPAEIIDCDTCYSVNISPVENTTVEITLVHSSGCIFFRSFDITILDTEGFDIPNIFSPNEDGINDEWSFTLSDDTELLSLQIFDRWGNRIALCENERTISWDGKLNGANLVIGVYVYYGQYRDENGNIKILKGDITLVR